MNAAPHAPVRGLRAWSRRRHGTDSLPLRIDRRRIYILPTGRGIALAALVVAMMIAGLNYANNLALAFAFLVASVGIVGMHHCHRNLLGLRVDAARETDAFAGHAPHLRFTLTNESGLDRRDLEIRCGGSGVRQDAPAGATAALDLPIAAAARGVLRLEHFVLRTDFPFGWFRAWTYVESPLVVHVAPRPDGTHRLPAAAGTGTTAAASRDDAQGDADFAGLRPYAPGIPLKHMAWKTLAKGGAPAARRYSGAAPESLWLDWDALGDLPTEARLSQLCRWILDGDRAGRRYGLRLPGMRLEPAAGPLQLRAALRALAAFGAGRP